MKAIWIVFKDGNVGQGLRREKYQLRALHEPSNENAVPIEVAKSAFEVNQGNHKYVRKQFPMILGYAVTTHKSQGSSLVEVIIDFDSENQEKKPFIIAGTFYVAITRASKAENVFLKSFKRSFIKSNHSVARKMDTMRVTKPYLFFKIFNNDEVFQRKEEELKVGYLNINGILDANHNDYLNRDRNLHNLHILVVAESKLDHTISDDSLSTSLSFFDILHRIDAGDNRKHMGILIMSPKNKECPMIQSSIFKTYEDKSCQVVIQRFGPPINAQFAYVYMRPNCGSKDQVTRILTQFEGNNCDVIMGDLNLNPKLPSENERLKQLCSSDKSLALQEVTTRQKNQLDHILVNHRMKSRVFVTSFLNFISDHKSIVMRLGINNNQLNSYIIQDLNLRSQRFMKKDATETNEEEEIKVPLETKQCDTLVEINSDEDGGETTSSELTYECLEGEAWLRDDIINPYLRLLESECGNCFIFSSLFYVVLQRRGSAGTGWTRNENIFRKRFVLFPIHQVDHWYLIYADNEKNEIRSMDPYEYKTVNSKAKARREELKKLKSLQKYLATNSNCPPGKKYKEVKEDNLPKQTNIMIVGYSC